MNFFDRRPGGSSTQWLRELGGVMRNARKTFGLLIDADRNLAVQVVALTLADAVLPVAIAYVGKRIIDSVVAAVGAGAGATAPLFWVGAEALLMIAKASVGELTSAAQSRLRSALGLEVKALSQYNSFSHWGWLEDVPCLKDIEVVSARVEADAA